MEESRLLWLFFKMPLDKLKKLISFKKQIQTKKKSGKTKIR
jgi:hypothetical protein